MPSCWSPRLFDEVSDACYYDYRLDWRMTGCRMKVQSQKTEGSNQVSTSNETVSTQVNAPSDFFSELISSMLASPGIQSQGEDERSSDHSSAEQTQEMDTSKPSFDAVLSGMNPLLEQIKSCTLLDGKYLSTQTASSLTGEKDNSANINSQIRAHFLRDFLNRNIQQSLVKADQSEVQMHTSAMLINNIDDEKLAALIEDQKLNSVQQNPGNPHSYETVNQDSDLEPILNAEGSLPLASPKDLDLSKNLFNVKSQKLQQLQVTDSGSLSTTSSQTQEDSINQYPVSGINPAINPIQHQLTDPVTVYTAQKGQVQYMDNQKNKYVDSLVQLGNMINAQTTLAFNDREASVTPSSNASGSYADIFNKLNQHDYDLKIDLLPPSQDALMKESYDAHIKIYPPELGAVVAKLKLDKNNAELIIVTEHNRVKEVIQANIVQLRENFQNADINLTNIQVDVQTSQQGSEQYTSNNNYSNDATNNSDDFGSKNKPIENNKPQPQRLNSLVDTYA